MDRKRNDLKHGFKTGGDSKLVDLLDAAKEFVNDLENEAQPRWLSILGPSGCGKSHLASAILKHAQTHHRIHYNTPMGVTGVHDILFVDANEILTKEKESNWQYIDRVCSAFLVVLDDMGAPRDKSGFIADAYLRICNRRLGKWMVITSNLYAEDIGIQLDRRIASRLYRNGSKVIESTAPDWNLR